MCPEYHYHNNQVINSILLISKTTAYLMFTPNQQIIVINHTKLNLRNKP